MALRELQIRNSNGGCIWQVYHVQSSEEISWLIGNALCNGFTSFSVEYELQNDETYPNWRTTANKPLIKPEPKAQMPLVRKDVEDMTEHDWVLFRLVTFYFRNAKDEELGNQSKLLNYLLKTYDVDVVSHVGIMNRDGRLK